MKNILRFVRTTIAGGLLFIVPFVVLLIILEKAMRFTGRIVAPLAARIPVHSVIGVRMEELLAIAVIFLACFLAGCIARLALARSAVRWLESTVLCNLPGYEFFKLIGAGILGVEPTQKWDVVAIRLEHGLRLGFLVERLDNHLLAVFVPDAPNPHSGTVHFVSANQIQPVQASTSAALRCMKRLGAGSNALFGAFNLSEVDSSHPSGQGNGTKFYPGVNQTLIQ